MYIVYKAIMGGDDTFVVEEDAARAKELYNENVNDVNLFTAGIAKIVKSTEAHHTDSNDDILANINFLMLDKQREHLNTIIDSLDTDSELRNSMEGIQNLLDAVSDEEFHKKEEDLHQQARDFMDSTGIDALSLDEFLIQYKDTLTEAQLKEGYAILHKFPEYQN